MTIATFPADWPKALRFRYTEKLAELRPAKPERTAVKTVAPAPKHSLKPGGIAERAMTARYAQGFARAASPSQPFLATKDGPQPLPSIDELPDHSAPPRDSPAQVIALPTDDDGLGIPPMFDRRRAKAAGGAEAQGETAPSYVDLMTK